MKRYSVLSVLWLIACGAGAGASDEDGSSLSSPLSDGDDDKAELASGDNGDDPPLTDDVWNGASQSDEAPTAGSAAGPAPTSGVVIGGGGQAWPGPSSGGVVVWCHADVPIGCPAIVPSPDAGRLVIVQDSGQMTVGVGGGADDGGHGEVTQGGSTDSVPVAAAVPDTAPVGAGATEVDPAPAAGGTQTGTVGGGGVIYVDAVPAPGAAPAPPLPVLIGGSVPPVSGTCVAITFGASDGAHIVTHADGEGSRVGSAGVAPQPHTERVEPGVPDAPSAGAAAPDQAPSAGASAVVHDTPPPPALPPPGVCIGVSYSPGAGVSGIPGTPAAPSSGTSGHPETPDEPGAPVPGYPPAPTQPDGPVAVPAPPVSCVSVAFASGTGSNSADPMPALPVMCALPVPVPPGTIPGEPARPEGEDEDEVRADEVR